MWRYWTQRTGTRWAIVRQSDQGGSPIVECDCPSEALAAGAMADCKARFVKGGGLVAAEA